MIGLGHVIVERYSNIVKIIYWDFVLYNTLKCNGRCSVILYMECTNISIPIYLLINLKNSVESNPSCVEIYCMVDETTLLHIEWLRMKCKYETITPVTLYFNESLLFENKHLKVGLIIFSDITVYERTQLSQDFDKLFKKIK